MKKYIYCLFLLIFTMLCFNGCAHEHEYAEATCTEPATCTICGETEGEPLGHDYAEATCLAPMTCKVCGETQGELADHTYTVTDCSVDVYCEVCKELQHEATEHSFIEATCTEPKKCENCEVTEGEPLGHTNTESDCTKDDICEVCGEVIRTAAEHTFAEATCTEPKTCTVCAATEGEPLGHQFSEATCTTAATCAVCKETTGSPLSHSYAQTAQVIENHKINTTYTCSLCGDSYVDSRNYVTEASAYSDMIALKSSYPDGTPWDNSVSYTWKGGIYSSGSGCAGFAFMLSDAAFGDAPAKMVYDTSSIRVGDILRINDNTHSVIVLSRSGDTVTIAEGNYNSSVHWGRTLNLSETGVDYILTRY
jgi:hypothetical protein